VDSIGKSPKVLSSYTLLGFRCRKLWARCSKAEGNGIWWDGACLPNVWWPLWALGISEQFVYNKDAKIAVFVSGEGFTAATKIFCFVADLRGPDSHKFVSLFSSDRRKFGSQPSDSINGWKSRGGKSQRRERVSRKKIRERVRRKRMLTHEKVESRETLCFPIVL